MLTRANNPGGFRTIHLNCFIEHLAAYDCLLDVANNRIRIWAPSYTSLDTSMTSWTVYIESSRTQILPYVTFYPVGWLGNQGLLTTSPPPYDFDYLFTPAMYTGTPANFEGRIVTTRTSAGGIKETFTRNFNYLPPYFHRTNNINYLVSFITSINRYTMLQLRFQTHLSYSIPAGNIPLWGKLLLELPT
jgi:hypothetical protein